MRDKTYVNSRFQSIEHLVINLKAPVVKVWKILNVLFIFSQEKHHIITIQNKIQSEGANKITSLIFITLIHKFRYPSIKNLLYQTEKERRREIRDSFTWLKQPTKVFTNNLKMFRFVNLRSHPILAQKSSQLTKMSLLFYFNMHQI